MRGHRTPILLCIATTIATTSTFHSIGPNYHKNLNDFSILLLDPKGWKFGIGKGYGLDTRIFQTLPSTDFSLFLLVSQEENTHHTCRHPQHNSNNHSRTGIARGLHRQITQGKSILDIINLAVASFKALQTNASHLTVVSNDQKRTTDEMQIHPTMEACLQSPIQALFCYLRLTFMILFLTFATVGTVRLFVHGKVTLGLAAKYRRDMFTIFLGITGR